MRLVSAVAAILRRARAERGVLSVVFLVVAVTGFAVAAGPRVFERVASDALRYEAVQATPIQRNLQFSVADTIRAGAQDPLSNVQARGETLRSRLPGSVDALVTDVRYVVETARFKLSEPPRFTTFVTFRQQAGIEPLVELATGRWPERVVPSSDADPDAPAAFEVAVSDATAATIGVAVGDRLAAIIDPGDPLLRNEFPRPVTAITIDVVGLYAVHDAADAAWFGERALVDAAMEGTADAPIAAATGLFAPGAYGDLVRLALPMRYRWDVFVDPDRLDTRTLDRLEPDLRRLETTFAPTGSARAGTTLFRSGLLGVIDRYRTERVRTEAAVALAALGPLAVAAGAVGLLGILVVRRRRGILALARGRGASSGQLLTAQLWEGLLITIPAALVGLLLADLVVGGPPNALSASGAILVALAATALLLLATWPAARRARRDLERDDQPVFRLSPRRLVFETLIVGLSLAAVWLLRERGLTTSQPAGGRAGFDPFLAAAPLLVGLAVGLILIRLYPIPVRGLGWITSRRRDLVPVLGLRAVGRHPAAGYLPLLILTLTVAIGTLSSVMEASLVHSQEAETWRAVGADYRVESSTGGRLDPGLDLAAIDGADAVATGLVVPDASVSTAPANRGTVLLEAVDTLGYDAIVAGTPVATRLAGAFLGRPTGPDAGSAAAPIPAILSTRLRPGTPTIDVGAPFILKMRGRTLHLVAVGRADEFPGIPSGTAFVIAPLESIDAGWSGTPLGPTVGFVRGGEDVSAALASATAELEGTIVTSRHALYGAMRDAPLVAAVTGGFGIALAVAATYAALAIVIVTALEARRRSREMAFLRTLGLTDRQVSLLTVVEQGAPLILALAVGVVLGLGLAWLVEPGIDLAAFSGAPTRATLEADWPSIAVVALGVVLVVVVAVALSSWVARRLDVGHALRIGED